MILFQNSATATSDGFPQTVTHFCPSLGIKHKVQDKQVDFRYLPHVYASGARNDAVKVFPPHRLQTCSRELD